MKKLSQGLTFAFSMALLVSTACAQQTVGSDIEQSSNVAIGLQQQSGQAVGQQSYVGQQQVVGQQRVIGGDVQALTILPPGGYPAPPAPRLGFQGELIYGLGMRILYANYGSPAQRAGLESGDIITAINGRQIRSRYDYDQSLREAVWYNGGVVRMTVRDIRGGGWDGRPLYASVTAYLPVPAYRPGIGQPAMGAASMGASSMGAARSQAQPAQSVAPSASQAPLKGDF